MSRAIATSIFRKLSAWRSSLHLFHFGEADLAVLDYVVQQGGTDARCIEPHVRDDVRDRYRMDEIGVTGLAGLSVMHARCIDIGLVDQIGVRSGMISLHLFENMGEEDHGCALTD